MKTLGLVMIVKNESRSLGKCLSLVCKLADEIYITDTGSSDDTVDIAKKFHAHITAYEWKNDFAAARNYALEQSSCDWNLVLDADEYLISGGRKELQEFIERGTHAGAIQRRDSYREANGEISTSYTYTTRLIPKGTHYEGRIHEQAVCGLPTAPLSLVFDHDGYLQAGKGDRNLKILLEQLKEEENDPYTLYQISRTLWLMKDYERAEPYFERFYKYTPVVGTGYRTNGVITYIYNLLELKKFEKGLKIIRRETKRLADYADFQFACGTFFTQLVLSDIKRYIGYLPEIERSYLNCMKIGEVPEQEGVLGNGSFKAAYNLGVWYEVNGKAEQAMAYYRKALNWGYQPAAERMKNLL